MNQKRLTKLTEGGSILKRYSEEHSRLPKGAVKFGADEGNLVVGKDFVQSNLPHPNDPGFHFSPSGSLLRQGARLDIEGEYRRVFFRGGGEQFQPLGHLTASTTATPLPLIVPSLRGETEVLLGEDLQKLMEILKSLLL